MAWLDPSGKHGWAPPESPMNNIEPICAALNLCRFLLIREKANSTSLTQVYTSAPVCLVAKFGDLAITAESTLLKCASSASLHVMVLQICTPNICKQLRVNMGLLTVELQAAKEQTVNSANVEMVLAVSRGLEVLSRVCELLD